MTKFTDREINIFTARVLLREAALRREKQPGFSATLLQWAANARRRAAEAKEPAPPQGDLFGRA